jgi:hypothetical protein
MTAEIPTLARTAQLIKQAVHKLELDLSGFTVLTEAASGPYAVTPVIASMAGAKRVLAITADSTYATADEVIRQTRELERMCGLPQRVEIFQERRLELFAEADIVTNLGFVRPLDAKVVLSMRRGSVVPLMCEAWEYRPQDLDLGVCRQQGVRVYATNEDFPAIDVFAYSGWLALKMLFEAGIEIHRSKVIVASGDNFGRVIERRLQVNGIDVIRVDRLTCEALTGADAVILADYARLDEIIGESGDVTAADISRLMPGGVVVCFAGRSDVRGMSANGVRVYPDRELPARRMGLTLAHLGARPVVDLHAAGLKVGELACRGAGADSKFSALVQKM